MPDTGVWGWSTGSGGTHFHRVFEPLRVAAEHGIRTGWGNFIHDDQLQQYDTILGYELNQPHASEGWQRLAEKGQHRLIFDIDDAMWAPDWPGFQAYYTPEVIERLYQNARVAHVVTCGSPRVAEHMAQFNTNVHLVPYTMPAWVLDIEPPFRVGERRVIGFAGSPSHDTDFADGRLPKAMLQFAERHPGWDWHFWGRHTRCPDCGDGWPVGTVFHPWEDGREKYYASLVMDINIAPLKPTEFNRAKAALRFMENAALGICSVLQNLDPYDGYANHGVNAFLVSTPELKGRKAGFNGWIAAMDIVARSPYERAAIGAQARRDARRWTTEANIGRWLDAWNSVGELE